MGKMNVLRVRSFAKVNLGLEVLGRREDGYHDLRTLFQTVTLHDDVTVRLRPRSSRIEVSCDHPLVPSDSTNLAYRAAAALRQHGRRRGGVLIEIKKRIPVGGGLGGGSSNAATVLLALDHLWKLGLGPGGLHPLASRLGADVPFFLVGGTALGLGRGDEVYPLHRQIRGQVVIVDAGHPVATAAVFRRLRASLTRPENNNNIFCFISRELDGGGAWALLSNDLERAAFEESEPLRQGSEKVRRVLVREGALMAALTGSGSSTFGFFDDKARARRAVTVLRANGFRAHGVQTLSVGQFRRAWSSWIGSLA